MLYTFTNLYLNITPYNLYTTNMKRRSFYRFIHLYYHFKLGRLGLLLGLLPGSLPWSFPGSLPWSFPGSLPWSFPGSLPWSFPGSLPGSLQILNPQPGGSSSPSLVGTSPRAETCILYYSLVCSLVQLGT